VISWEGEESEEEEEEERKQIYGPKTGCWGSVKQAVDQ
jgi:hypothetical protein